MGSRGEMVGVLIGLPGEGAAPHVQTERHLARRHHLVDPQQHIYRRCTTHSASVVLRTSTSGNQYMVEMK